MPKITVREYYPTVGSRFSKEDAEVIGPTLVELSEEGRSSPEHVLDRARSSNSPIHRYFEWDDRKAAHLYRVDQAKEIIRSIRIKYVSQGVEGTTRAAYAVRKSNDDDREQARSIKVLHGETAFAFQMLENAMNDLRGWQKRYTPYQDMWDSFRLCLLDVIKQVNDTVTNLDTEDIAAQSDGAIAALIAWRDRYSPALEMCVQSSDTLNRLHETMAKAEAVFAKMEAKHKRKCISCERDFLSTGPGNRMCDPCRAKIFGDEYDVAS